MKRDTVRLRDRGDAQLLAERFRLDERTADADPEMDGNQWYQRDDSRLARAIERVWRFGRETLRPYFPPGLYRHRNIDDDQCLAET